MDAAGCRSFLLDRARTASLATVRSDGRPHVLCVDDDKPPFAFVLIEGVARASERDPDLRYWATRIVGRYTGEDLAEGYRERNSVEGGLLLRVTPDKIVARKNISD